MFDFLRLARRTWYRQGRGGTSRQESRGLRPFQPCLEVLEDRSLLSTGNLFGLWTDTGSGTMSIVSVDTSKPVIDPSNPGNIYTLLPESADYVLGHALTVEPDGDIDFSAIPRYTSGPIELFRFHPSTGEVTLLNPGYF